MDPFDGITTFDARNPPFSQQQIIRAFIPEDDPPYK